MPIYLITGASRGLGLNYAIELLRSSTKVRVVAAVRDPPNSIELVKVREEFGEDRVKLIKCDVTREESVKEAVTELESSEFLRTEEGGGIDALLANAGVLGGGMKPSTQFTREDLDYSLETNLFGVVNSVNGFLPLLRKGGKKQIFVTSSIVGSIGGPLGQMAGASAYAISKAAVNMYSVKLARELAEEGFTVIPFHPGYVKTDMNGGTNGDLTPQEAGELATKNIFLKVEKNDNGKFKNYDGKDLPW
ncbi:hypothetical protein JCM5350_002162 [Sporobolomyces pararoseus]